MAEHVAPRGFVHPFCLAQAQTLLSGVQPAPVALHACNRANARYPVGVRAGLGLVARSDDPDDDQASIPRFYAYRIVGRLADGREIAWSLANHGGSSDFSDLLLMRRLPAGGGETMLRATPLIHGGDRCAGGLVSVRLDAGSLLVVRRATPAGLMRAAGLGIALRARLPDGVRCCVAELSYRVAMAPRITPRLVSARLLPGAGRAPAGQRADAAWGCLSRALDAAGDGAVLDAHALTRMGQQVRSCLAGVAAP